MSGKILKGGEIRKKEEGQQPPAPSHHGVDMMPDSGGIVHRKVMDANEEARRILSEAEAEAARLRMEAKNVLVDAENKRQEAIKQGYASGESKGLSQVTEKLIHLERLREKFYENAEHDVVELVLTIAEKVIGKLVVENAEMVRSVVHQALESALGDRIVVKLNPEDHRAIMESDHEFRSIVDKTRRLSFREDESIGKGGCIVETEVGTIDARIETQLAAIRKALTA
jgi:flagellar biosynthesis/type III secretory pathway protein FliH